MRSVELQKNGSQAVNQMFFAIPSLAIIPANPVYRIREKKIMTQEELLRQLEELAGRININIRYESLRNEDPATFGGLCRIEDQAVLFLHAKATVKRKIAMITEALKRRDIDELYLRPALREHLKKDDSFDGDYN